MAKYQPDQRLRCPHCATTVRLEIPTERTWRAYAGTIGSPRRTAQLTYAQCPECQDFILTLEYFHLPEGARHYEVNAEYLLWPLAATRDPITAEVPLHIAQDYLEAAQVLPFSPKASAALSRRCLQTILREAGKTAARDLSAQIDEVMPTLPSHVGSNLDSIRAVGNFAAHPMKSQATGEIIEVEPGEAEWNLDVLDALFDFYYVRPSLEQKKRAALDAKLKDAGKPPLK